MIALFIAWCLYLPEPDESLLLPDPFETAAITLVIQRLSAPSFEEREEAFFSLQRLGHRAVLPLKALQSSVDFQARLRIEYLLDHVPLQQEMAAIPGGVVKVGTDDPYCKNPLRVTPLQPYALDKYEVTNFMYYVFIRTTGHHAPDAWKNGRFKPGRENYPVTGVSFRDASSFARWAGKRLPTADEWEYAARGDTGHYFPWGSQEYRGAANIDNVRSFQEKEVASHPDDRGPFGCMDMAGNVSEWVAVGPEGGYGVSAIKGSAYTKSWRYAMVCYKALPKSPSKKSADLGFRCAR